MRFGSALPFVVTQYIEPGHEKPHRCTVRDKCGCPPEFQIPAKMCIRIGDNRSWFMALKLVATSGESEEFDVFLDAYERSRLAQCRRQRVPPHRRIHRMASWKGGIVHDMPCPSHCGQGVQTRDSFPGSTSAPVGILTDEEYRRTFPGMPIQSLQFRSISSKSRCFVAGARFECFASFRRSSSEPRSQFNSSKSSGCASLHKYWLLLFCSQSLVFLRSDCRWFATSAR